jgi:hypothetical protein
MAIIPKQIGWSQESNLLWELLKKVDRLNGIASTIGGGGGPTDVNIISPDPINVNVTNPDDIDVNVTNNVEANLFYLVV